MPPNGYCPSDGGPHEWRTSKFCPACGIRLYEDDETICHGVAWCCPTAPPRYRGGHHFDDSFHGLRDIQTGNAPPRYRGGHRFDDSFHGLGDIKLALSVPALLFVSRLVFSSLYVLVLVVLD
jgi:hypothetical protein